MTTTSLRLPADLTDALDRLARERGTSRSEIMREALEEYLAGARRSGSADRLALLRSLVTYPGSGRGDLGSRGEVYLREMFRARRRRAAG